MSENQPLDDLVKKIKSSPLFYLFSASKEEFHSNFWKWLSIINEKETYRILTGEEPIDEKIYFEREVDKVDLIISSSDGMKQIKKRSGERLEEFNNDVFNKGALVVFEHKIKDFATIEQLDKIKNKFGNKINPPKYILISLFSYPDLKFDDDWKIVTYKDIADKLDTKNFNESGFSYDLIDNYKKFLEDLSKLASSEELNLTDEYNFFSACKPEIFSLLNDVKLAEGYKKYRASHLSYKFHEKYKQFLRPGWSIHNKGITIDFYSKKINEELVVGIQLEEKEYRIYIKGDESLILSKMKDIFSKFENIENKQRLKSDGYQNKEKTYKKYKVKEGLFIYRVDTTELPKEYDKLFEIVKKDIEIINKIKLP